MNMLEPKEDLTGKRYGALTVIGRADDYITPGTKHRYIKWICQCDCGNITSVFQSSLKSGSTKSCGCMHFQWNRKYNEYEYVDKKTVRVYLTNCDESFICDADDWERLKEYCWSKGIVGYPEARINKKNRLFHHMVLPDCPKDMVRDHINLDKLDNRKKNLRIVTRSENNYNKRYKNKHGYRGIVKKKNAHKGYYVVEYKDGKKVFHGGYKTLEEAINKSKEIYGHLSESYEEKAV